VAAFDRISDYPGPALPVRVTVGGRPAEIQYVGAAPHSVAGLLQVNFRIPADAPIGDAVPLVLTVGEGRSPEGVTMAVRSTVQRVLVVKPDPAARAFLKRVLAGAGYDVAVARNVREAAAQAEAHAIDLAIFSLAMPEAERMEAMHGMLAARPAPKVVATAGTLGPRTLRAADLLGAQAVLTKPLSSKVVLERVRELLRWRPVPYVVEEEGEGKMAR
jgi:CheY-like chemotaxis protein